MTEQKTEAELMTVPVLEKMLKEIEVKHKKVMESINKIDQEMAQFNQERNNTRNQLLTDGIELQGQIKLLQEQIKKSSGANGEPSNNGEKPS